MTEIQYGECECGCGQKTKIPDKTNNKYGWVKGVPRRFVMNHDKRAKLLVEDAQPFKINGVYCRLIPLTQGQFAVVDASDYEWLMQWKWYAHWSPQMKSFYAKARSRDGNSELNMHSLIAGTPKGHQTDHENHLTLDNRRNNVRPATAEQNAANRRIRSDNKSGYRGVHWNVRAGKWYAAANRGGERFFAGAFDLAIDAARAYDAKAREIYGAFAKLNFPDG